MIETIGIATLGYLLISGVAVNAWLVIRGMVSLVKQLIKGVK